MQMEQWFVIGQKAIQNVEFTSAGAIYYSASQTIVFPQSFVENPSFDVSVRTSNLAWAGNVMSTTTQGTFQVLHSTNVTRNVAIKWQAIGKWK